MRTTFLFLPDKFRSLAHELMTWLASQAFTFTASVCVRIRACDCSLRIREANKKRQNLEKWTASKTEKQKYECSEEVKTQNFISNWGSIQMIFC